MKSRLQSVPLAIDLDGERASRLMPISIHRPRFRPSQCLHAGQDAPRLGRQRRHGHQVALSLGLHASHVDLSSALKRLATRPTINLSGMPSSISLTDSLGLGRQMADYRTKPCWAANSADQFRSGFYSARKCTSASAPYNSLPPDYRHRQCTPVDMKPFAIEQSEKAHRPQFKHRTILDRHRSAYP